MTRELQTKAIAEACGWERVGRDEAYFQHRGIWKGHNMCGLLHGSYQPIPDYLNDLNAMHEAEMTLDWNEQASTQADEYRFALTKTCGNDRDLIHIASASHRAEAFLKTIGKWTDSPATP